MCIVSSAILDEKTYVDDVNQLTKEVWSACMCKEMGYETMTATLALLIVSIALMKNGTTDM